MDFQSYSQAADTKSIVWNGNLSAPDPYYISGSMYQSSIPAILPDISIAPSIFAPATQIDAHVPVTIIPAQSGSVYGYAKVYITTNLDGSDQEIPLNILVESMYYLGIPITDIQPDISTISISISGNLNLSIASNSTRITAKLSINLNGSTVTIAQSDGYLEAR